jgi:hypothetical protein
MTRKRELGPRRGRRPQLNFQLADNTFGAAKLSVSSLSLAFWCVAQQIHYMLNPVLLDPA